MLPIPTHLHKILIPTGENNNQHEVKGNIQCSCGSEIFITSVFGDIQDNEIKVGIYEDNPAIMGTTLDG